MAPHKLEDPPISSMQETKRKSQVLSTELQDVPSLSKKLSAPDTPVSPVQNITQLLARAAASTAGVAYYTSGSAPRTCLRLSYAELLSQAKEKSQLLHGIEGITQSSIVLLHFDSQIENIVWFWACAIGGFLPAISTPFVADTIQRKKHLLHLQNLLNSPVVLTTKRLLSEFTGVEELALHTVESLSPIDISGNVEPVLPVKNKGDIAVLMLTSGSTGNAKAVPLRHGQLISAIEGKSQHHGTLQGDVFLNWIGLDHVASLTEVHLHAMSLSGEQIHVPAGMLQDPLEFVRLLDSHKVAYTFAPNFFLTKVRDSLLSAPPSFTANLSSLRALISGGESNVVATCAALNRELSRYAVNGEVIRPGFGMTETCAGSIYSRACPSYDLEKGLEFANLGRCVPGLQMRVMRLDDTTLAEAGETGHLQVHGPVLFDHYFNNPEATAEAFTSDHWFKTGDLAYIDEQGCLNLTGRSKDTIIVNGVKWSSTEIETAIEEEGISGIKPSFTVAFPHRAHNGATEDICVVYSPDYPDDDDTSRFEAATAISKTVSLICGKKPDHLLPLPVQLLEKSSLGKISRSKVRAAFEKGEYVSYQEQNDAAILRYRTTIWQEAKTPTERIVQSTLAELLGIATADISMKASIFELGIDSFNLIAWKALLQEKIDIEIDIPMSILLTK